jgi:hypothetical protein
MSATVKASPAPSAGVRSDLTRLYTSARSISPADVAGLRPGSLREYDQASTHTWWATAGFLPRSAAPARVLDSFQDGASTLVFTRRDGGGWRILRTAGSRPLGCRGALPATVQHAWRLTAPAAACTTTPSLPDAVLPNSQPVLPDGQAALAGPPTASAAAIAAVAAQNVGIGDTPVSINWSHDCDPYTTMVNVSVSTSGCGVNSTYGVQDKNEFWCADFAKWAWERGGVTAGLSTLDPAAASFYTWGKKQGESMPKDPGDPVVGDAVVFYPAGSPPNGNYADHVGIITGVNANGTVNLVNGDFIGASNITVQYNTDVNLRTWSAAVWAPGEQWIFVSPSGPPQNTFEANFQAAGASLDSYGAATGAARTSQVMAAGTSPAIAALAGGGDEQAFQAKSGQLVVSGPSGTVATKQVMAPGTSPAIAAAPDGGFEVAFQASDGDLQTYTPSAGPANTKQAMAPGTSPAIAALATGGYEEAFQTAAGTLAAAGSGGSVATRQALAHGTSPAIAAAPGGGFEAAFQASPGQASPGQASPGQASPGQASPGMLGTYNSVSGLAGTTQAMKPGTNPAITALVGGTYEAAFQSAAGVLTDDGTGGVVDTGQHMAAGTSPAIGGLAAGGYEQAFQASSSDLGLYGSGGDVTTKQALAAGTGPGLTSY